MSVTSRSRWRIGSLVGDVRYAFRRWRRRPGFTATAVLTLALGIGTTTAIFSVVDDVLLAPLPWTDPDRLAAIYAVFPERRAKPATAATWNVGTFSAPAWDALRRASAFESVAVWRRPIPMTLGEARTDLVPLMDVSSNFLPVLGVRLVHGRFFTVLEDEKPSRNILISHEAWQRRFGGRPDIIGHVVTLDVPISAGNPQRETVVGVIAPGFTFKGDAPEIFKPIGIYAAVSRSHPDETFRVLARLAPGATFDTALAASDSIARSIETREPTMARVVPLRTDQLGEAAKPLWLLFAGAGLLLLVACSNVAGLLLGEARARRHEVAVRLALGSGGMRIVRQLLVEHVLLAAVGAAAGLVLAYWLTQSIVAIAPASLPRLDTVQLDARVAWFALGLGGATLLLFGIAPALSLARTPAAAALAEGGRDGASGRHLGQRAIVAAEIALALVLLVGASLLGETMFRLISQPLGFNPANLAMVSTTFTGSMFGDQGATIMRAVEGAQRGGPQGVQNFRQVFRNLTLSLSTDRTESVLRRLSALPGVVGVAGASSAPFAAPLRSTDVRREGESTGDPHQVSQMTVTERYFQTIGMPIVSGRGFDPSDRHGVYAAVVSREFERRLFTEGAIGRRFAHIWSPTGDQTTYDIVGVVANAKHREFTDEDRAMFYTLDRQAGAVSQFIVRTARDAEAILPAARAAIAEAVPQMIVTSTTTMEVALVKSIAEERFRAMLSACFGGAALVLAAVGLYGLATRRAADRRREFGVRVPLGAGPANVRALVLRDAMIIVGLGLALGLPAAYAASQITGTMLFGVSPTSPHIFFGASAVLATAAILASLGPARRASRLDPIVVLRE